MALANLSIYYTWKNIKSTYNNNKFKISVPTWNDQFVLPDGSYPISDIQDCFEYIIKKHRTIADNPPVQIYTNEIKSRIILKIKTGYKVEIMKLLVSRKKDVDQDKDGEDVSNQNLLRLFQQIVIQSIKIINKHLKYDLLLYQINNLDSQLIYHLIH